MISYIAEDTDVDRFVKLAEEKDIAFGQSGE